MAQVNLKDGYLALADIPEGKHTIGVCNMVDKAGASIEMDRDDIAAVREMLWDVIRKDGRGFGINIEDVLKIEEVQHKPRYSVSGYEEEIEWTIRLLQTHLRRVASWKNSPENVRGMFGKLGEFLSQFEEM